MAMDLAIKGKARLATIVLRPCPWEELGLDRFPVLPEAGIPASQTEDLDQTWLEIVRYLERNFFPKNRTNEKKKEENGPEPPFQLSKLNLVNFKCFRQLKLDFDRQASTLPGNWTCIAGINGAGKSSVLEAICLALLGDEGAVEIGREFIGRKCRHANGQYQTAEISLRVKQGETIHEVEVPLKPGGIAREKMPPGQLGTEMRETWERIAKTMLVSFGATRNISEFRKADHQTKARFVRRQMTLFDPLAQLEDYKLLFNDLPGESPLPEMLQSCFDKILSRLPDREKAPIRVRLTEGRTLFFEMDGAELSMHDLPDGFRSMATWIAGVCQSWLETYPEKSKGATTQDIDGIVLLDEIDLHLHASLQRIIVPCLRACFPKVQWVITTHSPLVLFSFDKAEIVLLDPYATNHQRGLDRQIMGFTIEQMYQWLLNTKPNAPFIEEQLALVEDVRQGKEVPEEPLTEEALAMLINQSPHMSEEQVREQQNWLDEKIRKRKAEKSGS
ncbi:MAG: AAA family ATPase [Acidobacteriota bacterium]|nr:AAA family ATPase [Acidobacteriota bacterium]